MGMMLTDGIMKAVPSWDRLFYPALYPALYGQFRVAIQPGKWSQPVVAQHERVASRHPTAGGQNGCSP